jgi:hypothetical protein
MLVDAPHEATTGAGDHLPQLAQRRLPDGQEADEGDRGRLQRFWNAVHYGDAIRDQMTARAAASSTTIVVVTGDHGEEFERILQAHENFTLVQTHVPFVVGGPGFPQGVEQRPTCHVDLAPTILEICGADPKARPSWSQGENLLAPPEHRDRIFGGWEEAAIRVQGGILRVPLEGSAGSSRPTTRLEPARGREGRDRGVRPRDREVRPGMPPVPAVSRLRPGKALRELVRGAEIARDGGARAGWIFLKEEVVGNTWTRLLPGEPRVECNVCGWRGRRFLTHCGAGYVNYDAFCPRCMCYPRQRGFAELLGRGIGKELDALRAKGGRRIFFAPEPGMRKLLTPYVPGLEGVDIRRINELVVHLEDIQKLSFPTASVDFFLVLPRRRARARPRRRAARARARAEARRIGIFNVPMTLGRRETVAFGRPNPLANGHWFDFGRTSSSGWSGRASPGQATGCVSGSARSATRSCDCRTR